MTLTLYRSGSVHAPAFPHATALLADSEAGEIVWVGTDEAAARLGDPDVELDLDGRLMVPAFVDAWALDGGAAAMRAAAEVGIGEMHVLAPSDTDDPAASGVLPSFRGPRVLRYEPVEADSLDDLSLTERYEEGTRAGEQAVVVARHPDGVRRVVVAAAAAADRTGSPHFVAARHRLHVAAQLPADVIPDLAQLGLVVCFGGAVDGRPLRALAAAGVAFAFGSHGVAPDPWSWVAHASEGGERAISGRAAFAAATRGGHRAARADEAGQLRPGATATFAVWEFEGGLVVRTPDARVAAWSTDPRAATPGLPELSRAPSPRCCRTVVEGVLVFDDGGLG